MMRIVGKVLLTIRICMIGNEKVNSMGIRMMIRANNKLVMARSQVREEILLRLSASSVVSNGIVLLNMERILGSVSSVAGQVTKLLIIELVRV